MAAKIKGKPVSGFSTLELQTMKLRGPAINHANNELVKRQKNVKH